MVNPEGAVQSASTPAPADVSLWAGFVKGPSPAVRGLADLPAPSTNSGGLAAVMVLTAGIVALFGGFAAAELRRRRIDLNPVPSN